MAGECTLNGLWSGWYGYAGFEDDRVPFTAWIEDRGGMVEGSTLEPNTFSATAIEELEAEIAGMREGADIDLVKRYRPGQGAHGFGIAYTGRIEQDGSVVAGRWQFLHGDPASGDFRLERRWSGQAATRTRAAELDAPTGDRGVSAGAKPR